MMNEEVWRAVIEAGKYEVSNLGRVRNALTKEILKANMSGGAPSVTLYIDNRTTLKRGVRKLMESAFSVSQDGEKWKILEHAYQYSISNLGRVRNNKTGRILKPNANGQIVMMDAGYRVCRTVSRLRKEAFGA